MSVNSGRIDAREPQGARRELKAGNLSKRYKSKIAVDDVSLRLADNEVVGLLGPNGAGKTTTFYLMAGLIAADTGSIELDGIDITDEPIHKRARRGIGYLPQESSVFKRMTTRENLVAVLQIGRKLSRARIRDRVDELLDEFTLTDFADRSASLLSGGERRRLEIARTLCSDPSFILLDEPFAGIDPITANEMQSIIKYLNHKNIGVLITDHNVSYTLPICSRAYLLYAGRILESGRPESIASSEAAKRLYLGERFRLDS